MKVKNFMFCGFAATVLLSAGVSAADAATARLASKDYVDNQIQPVSDKVTSLESNSVTNTTLNQTLENYVKSEDLGDYVTDSDLNAYQLKLNSTNVTTEGASGVLHTVTANDGSVEFSRGYVTNDDIADGTISQGKVTGLSTVVNNVNNIQQTVNNITSGDGALDPTDGSLNSGVVAEGNLETTLKNKINNKQDKSTADYALGTATGSWKALEDSEKAALTSGITSGLVGKIGVGTINAELGTDLVSAVNKLKDITESLPNDSAMSTLKGRVDALDEKVGSGVLDAGEADDLIEAVNSLYDDVQSALASISDKQDKSTVDYALGTATGSWKALEANEKAALTSGITSGLVAKIGTDALGTTAQNLSAAINELKGMVAALPDVGDLESQLGTLEQKVGSGTLSAGDAQDVVAAINAIYNQLTTLSADLAGKVDKKQATNNGVMTTDGTGNVQVSTVDAVANSVKSSLNINAIATWAMEECNADSKLCVLSYDGSDLKWTDVTKDE